MNPISTSGLPTVDQAAAHIKLTAIGGGQSEPTHEIIPNTATVSKIVVTGTNSVSSGSIAAYFTCSQPPLAKVFDPIVILKDEASVTTEDVLTMPWRNGRGEQVQLLETERPAP